MPCDPQELLTDNPCLTAMPPFLLSVVQVAAWCGINGNVNPPPGAPGGWFDPDVPGGWVNPDVGPGPIVNPDL